MMPRNIILFAMAISLPVAAADFQKTYDDAPNRRITIVAHHGDIKLSGYDGENIEISAVKKGTDRDQVVIEDISVGNHIHIFSRYSDPALDDATVDFEIRLPKEVFYIADPDAKPQGGRVLNPYFQRSPGDAPAPPGTSTMSNTSQLPKTEENRSKSSQTSPSPKTLPSQKTPLLPKIPLSPARAVQLPHAIYLKSNSGQISVSDIAGSIRLEGLNIEIQNVEGTLYAFSTSGDIKGVLKQTSRRSVFQFSSSSGNILLHAPEDIGARVNIQSSTGQVKTDFPLETRDLRYGSGKFIQGRLGDGNHTIEIRSSSGAINFLKNFGNKK